MSDESPSNYTLAVPGSDRTRELSRQEVLSALSRGEITSQHWAWSPQDEDWKQLSEFPEFQQVKPIQVQAFSPEVEPLPKKVVRKKAKKKPREEGDGTESMLLKILFGLLFIILAGIVGLNYFLIDDPFEGNLAQTPFILIPAHERLGGLVQPNSLVVHVLPNHDTTENNLADLLSTLAASTPAPPLFQYPFRKVDLTSSWRSQYSFTGEDWSHLGHLEGGDPSARKAFIIEHLDSTDGQPLLVPGAAPSAHDKIWQDLVTTFVSNR